MQILPITNKMPTGTRRTTKGSFDGMTDEGRCVTGVINDASSDPSPGGAK